MGSSYPSNLDAFSTVRTTGQVVLAATDNDHSDAINKIEAELGTNPSGSAATVDARFLSVESSVVLSVTNAAYGATGDGTTNDRAAIQAALDALNALGGGTLFFPHGTYKCSTALTLYSNVTLRGEGTKSNIQFAGTGRFIDLTGLTQVKFERLGITLLAAASTSTAFYLSGTFRCSWLSCVLTGQHSSLTGSTYYAQKGFELRSNSGDNRIMDCDLNNLGVGVATSAIQNYVVGCVFGTNYRSVHGDSSSDNAGISIQSCTFTGSAAATARHLLCDVQANRWWVSNSWFEGADVAWELGATGVGGPASFGAVNCMVAATTRCIDVVYARQTSLTNIHLAETSGATTCDPLRINATDALDGVAINIVNATTVGGFELDPSYFPARWFYIGRTKMQPIPAMYGPLTMQPEDDADVPLTINGRSATSVDLLVIKRGATIYYQWDKFGTFFAQQAGLSAKTSLKLTAADGTAFAEVQNQSADPTAPAANATRIFGKALSSKAMLARRDNSRVEYLPGSLQGTATWDPASLVNGASERKSVTVTGAAVGDPASAGLTTIAATGWDIQAAVIAADTVEVKITNNTGGTVDLGSGTVRAVVTKFT